MNVYPGDCSIIEHNSGRVSMIDICDGNTETTQMANFSEVMRLAGRGTGNFKMCDHNTNPIDYCKKLGIQKIFRFILTHPDMDHMDGFNRLVDEIGITNFWDSGTRKNKPTFNGNGQYIEEDWDRYVKVRDKKENGVTVVSPLAGTSFSFANNDADGNSGDALYILAPTKELLDDPDLEDDVNEGSYVILYRSRGGKVLFCGDAHDAAFDHIKENNLADVAGTAVMLAPHHGRDSQRSYEFLDFVQPKLTIIGCAPSEYIDYSQWSRRDLPILTSNQAGNIVLEIQDDCIDVYVENKNFVIAKNGEYGLATNDLGYYWLQRITD